MNMFFELIDKFIDGDVTSEEEKQAINLINSVQVLANYYKIILYVNEAVRNKTLIPMGDELKRLEKLKSKSSKPLK